MLITDDVFDAFLKCKTKGYLLSWAAAGDRGALHPISDWQKHVAEDFKRECRDLLIADNPGGCFIGTASPPDLIKGRYPLIVDPMVTFKDTASYIHALERLPLPLPKVCNRYMPIRFIPSEKITKNHQLHLAFDAFVLGNSSGLMPILGKVIYGRQKKVKTIKLNELIRSVESLVGKIRVILTDNTPPDLVLIAHCSECEFEARCRSKAIEKDDLSLLGGIKPKEVLKLRSRGIFTVTQLSYTFRPRKKSRRSTKATYPYHHSLKALAIRDKRIYVAGAPHLDMGATPVYLDVEGIPDRDFYYLIGVRLPGISSAIQRWFWADDSAGEERIWREFLNLIAETENPKLFHYGSYETAFLRHMKKRYGDAFQGGSSLDTLTEGARNILATIYGHIYFPTYSNSLKDIASFLGFTWSTENPSGQRSLLLRHEWELNGRESAKQELIAYNADDCEALEVVVKAIQKVIPEEGAPPAALLQPSVAHVDSLKPAWSRVGRINFALPELDQINKYAYWDYQRDRIYIRSNPRLRRTSSRKRRKKSSSIPVNVTLAASRPSTCPRCNSAKIEMDGRHRRLLYDLRFSVGGIKRWVTRYISDHYKCHSCRNAFASRGHDLTRHRYGLQLLAYVIQNVIELHIPQLKVAGMIQKSFGYPITQSTICRLKRRAVEFYRDTYEEIKQNLRHGKLVHADETHFSVKGKAGYVWVFMSMEEVIYVWSETREGDLPRGFLSDFKGVLVSDFYAAYDSIDCPQQRCLVHLIRDLNRDVLQEPFNQEMKELVHEFTLLLRPIIETIDRFGLKAYFLKKYKTKAANF